MPGWYGGTCRCCCICCVAWAWCTGGVVSVAPSAALRPWTAPSTLGLTLPNWMGALATFVLFPTLQHVDASSAPAPLRLAFRSTPPPPRTFPSLLRSRRRLRWTWTRPGTPPARRKAAPARLHARVRASLRSTSRVACFGRRLDRSRRRSTVPIRRLCEDRMDRVSETEGEGASLRSLEGDGDTVVVKPWPLVEPWTEWSSMDMHTCVEREGCGRRKPERHPKEAN